MLDVPSLRSLDPMSTTLMSVRQRALQIESSALQSPHSIVRVHAGITNLFRTFLDSQDFTEIWSLKLQSAATRFGSTGFKVNYFHRPAFLAQPLQFADQMAIAADMELVVEIGSVFKENPTPTNTCLEMVFENDYHKVVDMIDRMFLFVINLITSRM